MSPIFFREPRRRFLNIAPHRSCFGKVWLGHQIALCCFDHRVLGPHRPIELGPHRRGSQALVLQAAAQASCLLQRIGRRRTTDVQAQGIIKHSPNHRKAVMGPGCPIKTIPILRMRSSLTTMEPQTPRGRQSMHGGKCS